MLLKYVKRTTVFYLAVVFLLVCDRFLKSLASSGFSVDLLGNFFKFSFVKNYYIAFSLPLSGLFLNCLIVLIIICLIYYFIFLAKKPAWFEAGFVLMIVFGAASNLFDRVKLGYVVDYLSLQYFTIFNLADVIIFSGVVGLLWLEMKKKI